MAGCFEYVGSSYITASGEDTTAQLTAPGGRSSGTDFVAGRIQDDENPCDSITINNGQYVELEWCIKATNEVSYGETYRFRITKSGSNPYTFTLEYEVKNSGNWYVVGTGVASSATELDTYTLYPEWKISEMGSDPDIRKKSLVLRHKRKKRRGKRRKGSIFFAN